MRVQSAGPRCGIDLPFRQFGPGQPQQALAPGVETVQRGSRQRTRQGIRPGRELGLNQVTQHRPMADGNLMRHPRRQHQGVAPPFLFSTSARPRLPDCPPQTPLEAGIADGGTEHPGKRLPQRSAVENAVGRGVQEGSGRHGCTITACAGSAARETRRHALLRAQTPSLTPAGEGITCAIHPPRSPVPRCARPAPRWSRTGSHPPSLAPASRPSRTGRGAP